MSGGLARGTIDADGRLVAADAALEQLNARAGGEIGARFAVPALATIARLARRLGVPVSRPVTVSDGTDELELWVKAQASGDQVNLCIGGWRVREPWTAHEPAPPAPDEWRWETDAALRLVRLDLDVAARGGANLSALLGQPLAALFRLAADDGVPFASALAEQVPLRQRRAFLVTDGRAVLLDADVRRDRVGGFAGYAGLAKWAAEDDAPPSDLLTGSFVEGLDRALRRPLARIVAQADTIHADANDTVPRDYAGYAADIAGAGRHLLAMIDDLVDLQAVERPDFAVTPEPIDLADLARRAAGLLSVRADEAGVRVARPGAEAEMPAFGDFRRVLQILVNLIGNAVRYAPRGSVVSVTADAATDRATVTVTDAGSGIAAADAERVFGKFERLDPTEPGGSGLGLYIARRLARAMGGDLTLESAPGRGARFTLSLPTR